MPTLRVQVCSDIDYENLIAEIYVDDQYVALVSREESNGPLLVEFPGPNQNEAVIARKVEFQSLMAALYEAHAKLGSGRDESREG